MFLNFCNSTHFTIVRDLFKTRLEIKPTVAWRLLKTKDQANRKSSNVLNFLKIQ